MSEIILTKEIAEQFHEDPESVDLNSYGEISEDAAEVLSEFYYYFEDVKELTLLTAETLSRYDGFLKINGFIMTIYIQRKILIFLIYKHLKKIME